MRVLVAVVVMAAAAVARADDAAPAAVQGQAWSVVGGRTVGASRNQLEGGVGFPGMWVSYLRGVASNVDLGVRGTFDYGLEGLVTQVYPGLKLQGLVKVRLLNAGMVSLAAVFEPGPFFYTRGYLTYAGFAVPFGVRLGIAPASALTLGVSFDVPLWVQFGGGGGLNVPILTGVGVEYFVRSDLGVFFRTRMGPTIRPNQLAEFTFDASLGVGWRF